jgi:hypothetical protein
MDDMARANQAGCEQGKKPLAIVGCIASAALGAKDIIGKVDVHGSS